METTQPKNGITRGKNAVGAAEERLDQAETALRERVEHARDIVEDLRDRAEMAFHERPYLLPVATGALGLGVGVLIGSKLSRLLFLTAAGALLSETVRGRVAEMSRDFIRDLGARMDRSEIDGEDVEDAEEEGEPAVT